MSVSVTLPYSSSAKSSIKGLLALSPEIILEISSHIISWDDLRSIRRDFQSSFRAKSTDTANSMLITAQNDLLNLRLTCRYLGEVLQRETSKSFTFHIHVTRSSREDVESELASLAKGVNPASRHATFLFIKCLDPKQKGYVGRGGAYFGANIGGRTRKNANAIRGSVQAHFRKAILSFQHLRCIAWKIIEDDTLNIRLIDALSSIPSVEDLALYFGPGCSRPSELRVDKFHDLRSLSVTFAGDPHPLHNPNLQHKPQNEIVDHLSDVVSQSPLLCHLSILQSEYDISFHQLTKRTSGLEHLESLHMALMDLIPRNYYGIHQLRALRSLRIDGPAESTTGDGSKVWGALAAARIELQDITVPYLSDSLLTYLASYSGLKRLRILMTNTPFEESMKCDVQAFFKDILPLHSLSLKINPEPGHFNQFLPSTEEGLIFESGEQNCPHSAHDSDIMPSWRISICIDSIPQALNFVMDCSIQCRIEKISISYSPTLLEFRSRHGTKRRRQFKWDAGCQWISDLEIADHDVSRYPRMISLELQPLQVHRGQHAPTTQYVLRPSQDKIGIHQYK